MEEIEVQVAELLLRPHLRYGVVRESVWVLITSSRPSRHEEVAFDLHERWCFMHQKPFILCLFIVFACDTHLARICFKTIFMVETFLSL